MMPGIYEIDLHGMHTYQAKIYIDAQLKRTPASVYRLRLIHGYQHGNALREMIRSTYKQHPKVLRLEIGLNAGQTDLVLREY